jgi:Skp family chaperone for outer membrane proteins
MRSLLLVSAVMCGVLLSSRPAHSQQPKDVDKSDEKAKLLEERLELQRKENELLKKENELLKRETELLKKEGKKDAGGKLFTGTTPRVGVVNIWTVVKNYKRTADLRAELQGIVKTYDDQLAPTKRDLEGRKAQLADDTKYTEDQKLALKKEVKRLERDISEKGEEMRDVLIKKESEQATGVFREIEDAIHQVAKSRGMDLVLVYGDTPDEKDRNVAANLARKINTSACIPLYVAPGTELTDEVLKRLNEKHAKSADSDGKRDTSKKDEP